MSAPAVELRQVRKSFGQTEIIRSVDLSIPRGERHAIIGPNGAGKTTLFNLISGRFQITSIFHRMTVFENIRCALLWPHGYRYSFWSPLWRQRDLNRRTEQLLEELNLLDRCELQAGLLSYAEQRALEIGITIAGGASVILLDEPTAGMSHSETEYAVALIKRITEGKTLVMVEHDMRVVFGLSDTISVVVYGELIASGKPEEIRASRAVQEAYLGALAE